VKRKERVLLPGALIRVTSGVPRWFHANRLGGYMPDPVRTDRGEVFLVVAIVPTRLRSAKRDLFVLSYRGPGWLLGQPPTLLEVLATEVGDV